MNVVHVVAGIWIRNLRQSKVANLAYQNVLVPHVLVARRAPVERYFPGCWEHPGGKVEEGETHEEALRREWAEELPDVCIEHVAAAWPGIVLPIPDGPTVFITPLRITARWHAEEGVDTWSEPQSVRMIIPPRGTHTPNHDLLRWVIPQSALQPLGNQPRHPAIETAGVGPGVPSFPWIDRWI